MGTPAEAEQWIRALEKIFSYLRYDDSSRIACALFQFSEEADYWWESVQRALPPKEAAELTWEGFKTKLYEKYIPQNFRHQKESQFWNLRQGIMSVTDYDRTFNRLSRYAPHLVDTDEKRADRFRRGLAPEVGIPLASQGKLSYDQALSRALNIEAMTPRDYRVPTVTTGQSSKNKRKWDDRQRNNSDNRGKKVWQGNTSQGQRPPLHRPNTQTKVPFCQRCKKSHYGKCDDGIWGCYKCGRTGHFSKEYPQNKPNRNAPPNQGQRQAQNQAGPPRQNQN